MTNCLLLLSEEEFQYFYLKRKNVLQHFLCPTEQCMHLLSMVYILNWYTQVLVFKQKCYYSKRKKLNIKKSVISEVGVGKEGVMLREGSSSQAEEGG